MKTAKKEKVDLIFKKWFKILLVLIALFTFIVSIVTLYKYFNKTRMVDEIKYVYDINNSLDYKVYLYENSFFQEEYLEKNKQYTAKLIDHIDIELLNSISVSKISNIEYDYSVNATIEGSYKNGNDNPESELWTRRFNLIERTKKNVTNVSRNEIKIPVQIDYQTYKNYVTEFQKQLRLDIDAVLKVEIKLDYKFFVEGEKVVKNQVIYLNIPLTEPTFKITTEVPENINDMSFIEGMKRDNIIILISAIILMLSSIFCGVAVLILFIRKTKKTEYTVKLNKILKDYGDIIAETVTIPSLEEQEVLEIKEFVDLVDIEEELKIPIIFYEKRKNKEGWFILNHGRYIYRYILKDGSKTKK